MPAKDGGLALLYSGPHHASVWLLTQGMTANMWDLTLAGEQGLEAGGLPGQELHSPCDGEAREGRSMFVKQLDCGFCADVVWRTVSRGF